MDKVCLSVCVYTVYIHCNLLIHLYKNVIINVLFIAILNRYITKTLSVLFKKMESFQKIYIFSLFYLCAKRLK